MNDATLRLLITRKRQVFGTRAPAPAGRVTSIQSRPLRSVTRVSRHTSAHRGASGRAVHEIEAAVVLRALDRAANDQAVREVHVPVRAQSIRGKKPAFGIAIRARMFFACNRNGSRPHGATSRSGRLRSILPHPVPPWMSGSLGWNSRPGFRQSPLDVICRILDLLQKSRNDLAPRRQEAGIRCGAVVLHCFVQARQRVVRHQRK